MNIVLFWQHHTRAWSFGGFEPVTQGLAYNLPLDLSLRWTILVHDRGLWTTVNTIVIIVSKLFGSTFSLLEFKFFVLTSYRIIYTLHVYEDF